jgi:hypothetical protein
MKKQTSLLVIGGIVLSFSVVVFLWFQSSSLFAPEGMTTLYGEIVDEPVGTGQTLSNDNEHNDTTSEQETEAP